MRLGLGPVQYNEWLDNFMATEGYDQKTRLYHKVNRCWCGSEMMTPLIGPTESTRHYQQCKKCGCLILRHVLPPADLQELYGIRYFREHQTAIGLPPFHERYEQDAKDRIPIWIEYLRKYCKKGSVLEVGCSHGRFVKELSNKGYNIVGLELDKEICTWARRKTGCDIRCNSVEEIEGASFDIVFANDVLEHLYNPVDFIDHLLRLLKPNGKAILQTVVFDSHSLPTRMMRPLYHTILFSSESLDRLVRDKDINLVAVDPGAFGCKFIVFAKNSAVAKTSSTL